MLLNACTRVNCFDGLRDWTHLLLWLPPYSLAFFADSSVLWNTVEDVELEGPVLIYLGTFS